MTVLTPEQRGKIAHQLAISGCPNIAADVAGCDYEAALKKLEQAEASVARELLTLSEIRVQLLESRRGS